MMRKQLIILGTVLSSVYAFSQCTINGKSSIKVLDEETYSVAETANCKECHLWVNLGDNASIIGNNKLSSLKLKANSGGRHIISLSILTSQGVVQCSKNINIIDSEETSILKNNHLPASNNTTQSNCDIDIDHYKEVKSAGNIVSLFPNNVNNEFRYSWIANYENGEIMKSTEKVAQFPFTKERGITSIKLQIGSKKCMKELSKTYEAGYWKFF